MGDEACLEVSAGNNPGEAAEWAFDFDVYYQTKGILLRVMHRITISTD